MNCEITITGIGLWAKGLHNWDEFCSAAHSGYANLDVEFVAPAPHVIPARERRRAPLLARLAVEVMHQACDMAGADKSNISSVFTSAMGDSEITEYMCRTLVTPQKMLSPTRFHNSVHNAPSGYWAISSGNRAPSVYVGGFKDSFATAFLEAAVISISESQPVVMAAYDIQTNAPLVDVCGITESFGCALVLDSSPEPDRGWPVKVVHQENGEGRSVCENPYMRHLMEANPAAQCLPLFDAFATERAVEIAWPTGAKTSLHVCFDG